MSVDEAGYVEAKPRKRMGVRSAVLASLDAGQFATRIKGPIKRAADLGFILRYCFSYGNSRKRRTSMQVDAMVDKWIEAVVGMCLAHDKDTYDAHDAKADELLGPLLAAPIKEVREFYAKLLERMHADKRVPMLVWMGFEAWGAVQVKDAPDEGVSSRSCAVGKAACSWRPAGVRTRSASCCRAGD